MRRVVPTLLCVVLLASACSDDDSTSDTVAADVTSATTPAADVTGTTSSSPTDDKSALCAALDELETSGDALRDVEVVAQGTNALEAAFSDVKDNLAAVRESAGDGLREALDTVDAAFDGLQDSVQGADTPVAKGAALLSGLPDLQTAVQDLRAAPEAASCT